MEKWATDFEKNFKSKSKVPSKKGKPFAIGKDEAALKAFQDACKARETTITVTLDLGKTKSDFSPVFLAQIIGKRVHFSGGKISFTVRAIEETMVMRRIRNVCRSEGAIARMAGAFARFGPGRDSTPEKEQHITLSMLAVLMGVPSPSTGAMDVKAIHKDLSAVFA
jgi:hypothetical protein